MQKNTINSYNESSRAPDREVSSTNNTGSRSTEGEPGSMQHDVPDSTPANSDPFLILLFTKQCCIVFVCQSGSDAQTGLTTEL